MAPQRDPQVTSVQTQFPLSQVLQRNYSSFRVLKAEIKGKFPSILKENSSQNLSIHTSHTRKGKGNEKNEKKSIWI